MALSEKQIKQAQALVDKFGGEPVDLASPQLSKDESTLLAQALLGETESEARQMVSIMRGEVESDQIEVE